MEKKIKIIIYSIPFIILGIIITVELINTYLVPPQEEIERNDVAKEMFTNDKKIYTITGMKNENLDSLEEWLKHNYNANITYSVERLDYYEFGNPKTGIIYIIEKSTGIFSYGNHESTFEAREELQNRQIANQDFFDSQVYTGPT